MEVQEIQITIDKNGKVEIHVRGIKGDVCLEITKDLEEALGGQIELRQMTPESLETNPNPIERKLDIKH